MRRILFITVLLLIHFSTLWSQTKDAGVWAKASVSRQYKDFDFSMELDGRTSYGVNVFSRYFFEFSGKYKVSKFLSLRAAYRYGANDPFYDYENYNRLAVAADFDKKLIKDVKLRYICQVQSKISRGINFPEFDTHQRNRLYLEYAVLKKLTVYGGSELFFPFNVREATGFGPDEIRYRLGVDWEFAKRQKLEIYYVHRREMNISDPIYDDIFSIGYGYEFKKWKKKKKDPAATED